MVTRRRRANEEAAGSVSEGTGAVRAESHLLSASVAVAAGLPAPSFSACPSFTQTEQCSSFLPPPPSWNFPVRYLSPVSLNEGLDSIRTRKIRVIA